MIVNTKKTVTETDPSIYFFGVKDITEEQIDEFFYLGERLMLIIKLEDIWVTDISDLGIPRFTGGKINLNWVVEFEKRVFSQVKEEYLKNESNTLIKSAALSEAHFVKGDRLRAYVAALSFFEKLFAFYPEKSVINELGFNPINYIKQKMFGTTV